MNERTGRTQSMIEEVCDMVESGGQRIIVMGHTMDFCTDHLMPRTAQCLRRRDLKPEKIGRDRIRCGECQIDFVSIGNRHARITGFRGPVVWDHYARWMDRFGPWMPPARNLRIFAN